MHAEGELCVQILVRLVAEVPHKGRHHAWVPQAHLVAMTRLGSDLTRASASESGFSHRPHALITIEFLDVLAGGGADVHAEGEL